MKLALLALVACFSMSTFASGYIHPKSVTCDELTDMLETNRSVSIVYGMLGISRGIMYAEESDAGTCDGGEVRQMNLRTSDGFCSAGYMCIRTQVRRNN